ncbi:hypothetical protein C8F01DRAFT_1084108 [Mycena amicta]|nr:hypothetical protein C8F01DRAFT_1084108 [Mycena amicta]
MKFVALALLLLLPAGLVLSAPSALEINQNALPGSTLEPRALAGAPNTVTARPVHLFNVGFGLIAGTFELWADSPGSKPSAQVLLGPEKLGKIYPIWAEHRVAADQYTFLNQRTGAPLVVYDEKQDPHHKNYLVTIASTAPTEFEVVKAENGTQIIKLPNEDLVATAIYDGSSMMFPQLKEFGPYGVLLFRLAARKRVQLHATSRNPSAWVRIAPRAIFEACHWLFRARGLEAFKHQIHALFEFVRETSSTSSPRKRVQLHARASSEVRTLQSAGLTVQADRPPVDGRPTFGVAKFRQAGICFCSALRSSAGFVFGHGDRDSFFVREVELWAVSFDLMSLALWSSGTSGAPTYPDSPVRKIGGDCIPWLSRPINDAMYARERWLGSYRRTGYSGRAHQTLVTIQNAVALSAS